ncbi:MAG TPA: cupin domain-containing protein [Acidimicrobiales bacterium]|nr:cupin domain-containing protein [Acidimicrobiales bacterium]
MSAKLAKGAEIEWAAKHGDEAIYVKSGTVACEDRRASDGSAIVVEADVPAIMSAESDVELFHFGPTSPNPPTTGPLGPAESAGHRVHILSDTGGYVRRPEGRTNWQYVYADSNCRSCRLNLFQSVGTPHLPPTSHTHSEDEIILMLAGEGRVGRSLLDPGMCIAIPGNYRYGFMTSGEYRLLNYRADASMCVAAPGTEPFMEFKRPEGWLEI